MKYIIVPEDIQLVQITGEEIRDQEGKPITMRFSTFLLGRLVDQVFAAKGLDGVLQGLKLRELFKDAKPGDVVATEDADHSLLVQATKNPTPGYNMGIAHCLVPFMRTICDARDKPLAVAAE